MKAQHTESHSSEHQSIRNRLFRIIFPKSIFNSNVSGGLLLSVSFLLPLLVLPGLNFGLAFTKTMFFQFGVILAALALIGNYLRVQTFSIPRNSLFYASWVALLFFALAGAFSPAPRISFFGIGGEQGTVTMIVLCFAALFISSITLDTIKRLRALLAALVGSTVVLLGYHFLLGPSSKYFPGLETLAGSYRDFSVFLAALLLIALSILYFYREKKMLRVLGYIGVFLPLPFLVAVDFNLIWYGLAIVIGAWVFVMVGDIAHVLCLLNERRSRLSASLIALSRVPRTSIVVFVIALAFSFGAGGFLVGSQSITSHMRKFTHIAPAPIISLSVQDTFSIARFSLADSLFFGVGPNRFSDAFLRFKDAGLNATPVWDKVYDQGFGFLPTLVVTTGLLGAATLLYFVFAFISSVRYLRRALAKERSLGFLAITLYTLAAFFLIFVIGSTPGVSVLGLMFIIMGAYVAVLRIAGFTRDIQVEKVHTRQNGVLTGMAVIKLLAVILLGFVLTREVVAFMHYRTGQLSAMNGEVIEARLEIFKAHELFPTDTYIRDISVLALVELDRTKRAVSIPKDELSKRAFDLIRIAEVSADEAIKLNPVKSKNFVQKGAALEALASLGVLSANKPAGEAYQAALLLDPTSPDVMYYVGRTKLALGDERGAMEWFRKAIAVRPSHKASLAALTSILVRDRDTEGVRSLLIRAVESDTNDASMRFALGEFYYKEASFGEAAKQFAAALRLDARYTEARFYLAAAAYRAGERELALQQFRLVQQSNPRHELLNQVISAIEQGNDPFREDIYGTQNI